MAEAGPAAPPPDEIGKPSGPSGADSIAAELAARIDLPAADPADAVDWAAAASSCQREARARGPGRASAQLHHQAGRIQEERLGNPELALGCYEAAVAADPAHLPSLQAARRLASQWGYAARECRLLEAEARATADPRRASALDLTRARLLAGVLGRREEALALLAQAAERDPRAAAVHSEHARLAAAEGRIAELQADWLRAAEALDDDHAACLFLLGAAGAAEDALGQSEQAAGLALRAFRRFPAEASARALAWRHAERLGRLDDLAEVLRAEGQEATSPRAAALALLQLARLEEERQRPEEARRALAEARQRAPSDPAVLAEVIRAAEAHQAWPDLADALQARLALLSSDPDAPAAEVTAAQVRLAEVLEQLGLPERAAQAYRAARLADPRNRTALSALGRLQAAAGDWERLLDTFLAERDASDDRRDQAQRLFKAGELLEERLARPEEAVQRHREALDLDPALLASARALERLLERLGRFAELAQLLERDLGAAAGPEQRIALLFRLARLREDRLDDRAGAAACYRQALELDPGHLLALRSLAAVLDRSGPSPDLAQALERAAAASGEGREAVAYLSRAGEVHETTGDEPGAAAAWERALALDPSHLPALRGLGRLCARAGRWEELVDMGRAEAQALPSSESAAALLVRVGDILETRLDRADEAVAAWREALELSPAHPGALRALARVHRARGELAPLVEVLRRDAAARSPAERAVLLHEAAGIQERGLGDPAGAARLYEEALRADPGFAPAHRALQRQLADQERWAELAAACRAEAEHAEPTARSEALWRLAWVSADRLGDRAAAEAACREIQERDPGHGGAALLLDRLGAPSGTAAAGPLAHLLAPGGAGPVPAAADVDPSDPVAGPWLDAQHRAAGRFAELAGLWEAREQAAADPGSRAECALRAGEAWEDAGDLARALAAHRRGLEQAPGSLPVLQALRRLRARAADWPGLHQALREEAAASFDGGAAAACLARAAEVASTRLGDGPLAVEDLRQAVARDPLDAQLAERLMELLRRSGSAADLYALREARARAEAAPARAAEEWLAAARAAVEGADRPNAFAALSRALELKPHWPAALLLRGQLLAADGRPAEAVKDLSACLALGADPGAAAPVHLELASLYHGSLADPARALSHLNAVLAASPENAEALSRLSSIHQAARNWPAVADALRRLVASPALAREERRDRLLDLAEVEAEGFGDAPGGAELCERALELQPGHARALELLLLLREKAGEPDGLVAALERTGAEAGNPAARAAAWNRAAQLLGGPMNQPGRAAAALRAGLEQQPGDLGLRAALAGVLATTAPEEAVEEHRSILERDAGNADSWRSLFALFHRQRAHDGAFVAASVLRFLRAGDPAGDGSFHAENAPLAPTRTAQVLGPADWAALRHPLDRGPLSDLIALVGEHLGRLLGEDPPDAPRVRGGHPVFRLLDEVGRVLGAGPFLLLEEGEGAGLALDATPADRVRVGAEFARRFRPAEQRFLLARVAARLRARNSLADHLGAGRLGEFLAAAVRQVDPAFSATGEPGDGLVRQVAKVLPRKVRKQLEELAPRLLREPRDVVAWYAAMGATGDRAGLLLAGDLPLALAVAMRDGAPSPPRPEPVEEVRAAIRSRPDLQALLRFAASEEHFRLRQKLHLAIA